MRRRSCRILNVEALVLRSGARTGLDGSLCDEFVLS